MFRDREEAGMMLAERLKGRTLIQPLVLAIPRGGMVTGAALARELNAELDVALSRKLRAPENPEYAIGAISEDGRVYLNPDAEELLEFCPDYLTRERHHQLSEIAHRQVLFREIRPRANVAGRSVILTDDGIATGSTMIAALKTVAARRPAEIIVAVPVAAVSRLEEIRTLCDELICLHAPEHFGAIGYFYDDFTPVTDQRAVELLRHCFVGQAA